MELPMHCDLATVAHYLELALPELSAESKGELRDALGRLNARLDTMEQSLRHLSHDPSRMRIGGIS